MSAAAVIIGIDDYASQPLTSCVNDALAFRRALLELGLVDQDGITLLTSALVPESSGPADGDTIRAALQRHYEGSDNLDRLYVYFAGHGMSGQKIGSVQGLRTVLVPADVTDFDNQGNKMIDLDELRDYLRLVGPREQFYFIDACRNLLYERRPNIGTLGWAERVPQHARSQSTLYAVAELGEAGAARGGHGFLTEHLLAALRGDGSALDHDPAAGWVVTPQSVRAYVTRRIQALIDEHPEDMAGITVPQLVLSDPPPAPLRVVAAPPSVEVCVHVEPDRAAPMTTVSLSYGPVPVPDAMWPPRANHTALPLQPLPYSLEAHSMAGYAEPSRRVLDAREEREVTVRVVLPDGGAPPAPEPLRAGLAPAHVEVRGIPGGTERGVEVDVPGPGGPLPGSGQIEAVAHESVVSIEVTQRQPPYATWTGSGHLSQQVPAGVYGVAFRLGDETFSSHEVFVVAGETATVESRVAPSSLMRDVLGVSPQVTQTQTFSESIGPIQAGMVQTMLPIIGIKPFDIHDEVFGAFSTLVPERVDPASLADCALSLVVALDGDGWAVPPPDVLRSVRARVTRDGRTEDLSLVLRRSEFGDPRIGTSVSQATPGSFTVDVAAPLLGGVSITSAALPGRATVISLRYQPTDRLEVAQNLLRFPRHWYPEEPVAHLSYGRVLRDLQLGMRLYGNGELLTNANTEVLQSLLYAKWSDPILGCMSALSLWDAAPADQQWARNQAKYAAGNLMRYFPELPDSHIVYGLTHPAERTAVYRKLLERRNLPVLARSTRELAAQAAELRYEGAWVSESVRSIPDRQPWTLIRTPAVALDPAPLIMQA